MHTYCNDAIMLDRLPVSSNCVIRSELDGIDHEISAEQTTEKPNHIFTSAMYNKYTSKIFKIFN